MSETDSISFRFCFRLCVITALVGFSLGLFAATQLRAHFSNDVPSISKCKNITIDTSP
jgi:hypothetical protein